MTWAQVHALPENSTNQCNLRIGDIVLYRRYSETELFHDTIDGVELSLAIIHADNIQLVLH